MNLEAVIYNLLAQEPYFAHFILQSRIVYDKWGIDTAAAGIVAGTPTIVLNSEYIAKFSTDEVAGLLKHEIFHLLLDHTQRIDGKDGKLMAIATDLAINQHIKTLPPDGVQYEDFKQICKNDIDSFASAEYYYYAFQQEMESNQQLRDLVESVKNIDNHGFEIPGAEKEGEIAKAAAKQASDKARQAAGSVSSELEKLLGCLNEESKVNWSSILRNFVSNATTSKTLLTRKKVNRRFGIKQPGRKKKRELVLGIPADSSGSVSDAEFAAFLNELKYMMPYISKAFFMDADCEIKEVIEVTSINKLPKSRKGCGGTAYQPAITACVERKCDAIVYFGDMDCADKPENPGIPVLWVSTRGDTRPGDFGTLVKMEI